MKRRVLALCLALVLLLGMIPAFEVTASAASSSADKLVEEVKKYQGMNRQQFLNAITARLGSAPTVTPKLWCADFISACAKAAGLSSVIPASSSVSGLQNNIINKGGTVVPVGSVPQPGDIAVFNNGQHVGVVVAANTAENKVTVVHGNWHVDFGDGTGYVCGPNCTLNINGQCKGQGGAYYTLSTGAGKWANISKYVRPNYSAGGGSTVCTSHTRGAYMFFEANHPHYDCYKCGKCGEKWVDRSTSNYYESCKTCTSAGKTSKPSVSVSGSSVTVSWTYSGNATAFTAYLIQDPWGWDDIKYYHAVGASTREYTFTDIPSGSYKAFVIAWPNETTQQSTWSDLFTVGPYVKVTTQTATDITATNAQIPITVESDGADIRELDLHLGLSGATIRYATSTPISDQNFTYTFNLSNCGLKPETTYYYKPVVILTDGTYHWGEMKSFTTGKQSFIPISGITLTENDVSLELGDIYHLIADVIPENASNRDAIIWRSSDENVAIVDDEGNVEGVSVGTATISATTLEGPYTDSCVVTVLGDIPVSGVRLSCGGLIFGSDKVSGIGSGTLETARIIPENATNTACIWTSSDPSVATVAGTGPTAQIEGVGVGTATITVTTVDGGYTDSLTITVCGGPSVDIRDDDVEIRIDSTWIHNNSDVAADITIKNNSDKAIDYILVVAAYGPDNQLLGLQLQDGLTIQAGGTSSDTVFLDVPWNGVTFKAFALRDGSLTPLALAAEI